MVRTAADGIKPAVAPVSPCLTCPELEQYSNHYLKYVGRVGYRCRLRGKTIILSRHKKNVLRECPHRVPGHRQRAAPIPHVDCIWCGKRIAVANAFRMSGSDREYCSTKCSDEYIRVKEFHKTMSLRRTKHDCL